MIKRTFKREVPVTTTATVNIHEYTVSTNSLYSNLVEGLFLCPEMVRPNVDIIEGLAGEDGSVIRRAFKDGLTPFIVPDLMEEFDEVTGGPENKNKLEIRVMNRQGDHILTVKDEEIQY